jgi:drug/metabolite transporter (DMT)-like permease
MAMIILKEKMNRARWISFGFAIVGVLIISAKDIQGSSFEIKYLVGDLLILTAILGNSLNNSFGKVILRRFTPLEMLFWTYCVMLILLLPFVAPDLPQFVSSIPHFTTNTWIGMILLTFFHNFLSMIIFLIVLKELDAIQVALTNYMITFFGLPIAALTLGEKLAPLAIIGGIFVLGSTLLITIWDKPDAAPVEAPVISESKHQEIK